MISIELSNKILEISNHSSLLELLEQQGLSHNAYAVALNGRFIPLGDHGNTILQQHDVIEIVVPMQGG